MLIVRSPMALLAAAVLASGCSEPGAEEQTLPPPSVVTACPAGELPREDGTCLALGIALEACGVGFEPRDQHGSLKGEFSLLAREP